MRAFENMSETRSKPFSPVPEPRLSENLELLPLDTDDESEPPRPLSEDQKVAIAVACIIVAFIVIAGTAVLISLRFR